MNRYQPKKYKSPAKAIREFCIKCMGGRENEGFLKYIENCDSLFANFLWYNRKSFETGCQP